MGLGLGRRPERGWNQRGAAQSVGQPRTGQQPPEAVAHAIGIACA
jgi:hypothetical protein